MSGSTSETVPVPSAAVSDHTVGAVADRGCEENQMWPDHRLINFLGIEHPLILEPMAGLDTVELAASVCAGGGLGSLGCVGLSPERVVQAVDKVCNLTGKPINTNFFCHRVARNDPAREADWHDRLAPYYREFGLDLPLATGQSEIFPFDDAVAARSNRSSPRS
jgi:nitronate monooxygenase